MKLLQSSFKNKSFYICCEALERCPDPPHGGYREHLSNIDQQPLSVLNNLTYATYDKNIGNRGKQQNPNPLSSGIFIPSTMVNPY